jgi:hypothetical protein
MDGNSISNFMEFGEVVKRSCTRSGAVTAMLAALTAVPLLHELEDVAIPSGETKRMGCKYAK